VVEVRKPQLLVVLEVLLVLDITESAIAAEQPRAQPLRLVQEEAEEEREQTVQAETAQPLQAMVVLAYTQDRMVLN
jgi:hypothetical protein